MVINSSCFKTPSLSHPVCGNLFWKQQKTNNSSYIYINRQVDKGYGIQELGNGVWTENKYENSFIVITELQ